MAYRMLDGNAAAALAIVMAKVGVVAAYPITPQTAISESLSRSVENGELKANCIRVESEHSAMSIVMGAALTGVRAATATSSVGLALMHEMLYSTAGVRMPVVMPVVNRSVASPWSLWCDHSDSMGARDAGWMQLYAENVQEVFDLMMLAYRLGEDHDVLTPTMVCLDGFFLSHSMQKVDVPPQEAYDAWVGPYVPTAYRLDSANPLIVNNLTPSDDYGEIKYQQQVGMENALAKMPGLMEEFEKSFGRPLSIVEPYKTEDAEAVLVTLGSMSGTAKYVVNKLRGQGKKVGVLKITSFRPFPDALIREALAGKPVVGVLDRSAGLGGHTAPCCTEVRAAISGSGTDVRGFIAGLAGRDISEGTIEKIFDELLCVRADPGFAHTPWPDLKDDPMQVREVMQVG